MDNSCRAVCEEIIRPALVELGLIEQREVKHGPMIAALDKVVLVTKEDLREMLNEYHPVLKNAEKYHKAVDS